ncbi:MAG: hypothetical protein ACJ789_13535 [Thermomicrobiales bacterium]
MADVEWMRPALDKLYDDVSSEQAKELLMDKPARAQFISALRIELGDQYPAFNVAVGDFDDNLFQALIAIRIKFEREEGREKVELNIAMRSRGK